MIAGNTYRSGRCSAALIESMGTLLTLKLNAAAFVTPTILLLAQIPCLSRAYLAGKRILSRGAETDISLDSEVAGVLMYIEFSLVFGVAE